MDNQKDTLVLGKVLSSDWMEDLAYTRHIGNFNKAVFLKVFDVNWIKDQGLCGQVSTADLKAKGFHSIVDNKRKKSK